MRKSRLLSHAYSAAVLLLIATSARGIVTGNITVSESNPNGYAPYTDFDWNYVYQVGGASGVAIAPYWLLTAKHVTPGNIVVNSITYNLVQTIAHPSADIRVAQYDKMFPGYYPIYTGSFPGIPEPPSQRLTGIMVGFGRTGTVLTQTTYNWGAPSTAGTKRWGDARIDAVDNDASLGDYFLQSFNTNVTTYAAGGADKDSGGGVFVKSSGTWYLAGTMVSVTGESDTFNGTISVRLPSYANWIASQIPEPSIPLFLTIGGCLLTALRRTRCRL